MKNQNKQIAETIIKHLGGNKFSAMTGAKNFAYGDKFVSFKIGKNNKKIIAIVVKYDEGSDLYEMDFVGRKKISNIHGIYAEKLADIFSEETGMIVRL